MDVIGKILRIGALPCHNTSMEQKQIELDASLANARNVGALQKNLYNARAEIQSLKAQAPSAPSEEPSKAAEIEAANAKLRADLQ